MSDLDLVLRAMAGTQLVFLALLLAAVSRSDRALRYAVMLPLGLATFMVTSAPMAPGALGAWQVPLTLVCVANPVWFWLFAEASFDDTFRPGAVHALALAAMVAAGASHEIAYRGDAPPLVDALFKAAILTCVAMAVLRVLRGRGTDLVEARRRARAWFIGVIGAYASIAVALQIAFDGRLPPVLVRANVVLLFVAALALSMTLALRAAAARPQAAAPTTRGARPPRGGDPALIARVTEAMETKRLYRDETLTVARLAQALGSQEYLVRRAINGGLGYRNFNEFLHGYRLGEAEARLRAQPHLPILTIALDVGYGSIGPFNRAFRARHGVTPSEYRAGSGIGAVSGEIGEPAP
jgi:AraC-like DNA-binding protein